MRQSVSGILSGCFAALILAGCMSTPGKPSPGEKPEAVPSSAPVVPAPAPAPAASAPATAPPPTPGGSAQTPEERRDAIDRRLDGSLGTFDETLRREQETVAQERDAREAIAGSATPEESGLPSDSANDQPVSTDAEDAPVVNRGARKPPPGESGTRPGDLKSDKDRAANGTPPGSSGTSVGEIPDGSDDDIVARRLRKAAEQETDPELKEKLWKEYVDYKKNAGQ